MVYIKSQTDSPAEVLLVVHVFVTGHKREKSLKEVPGKERTEELLRAYDNNWYLSRKIQMPYYPNPGTRIAVPLAPQDETSYNQLLEDGKDRGFTPLGFAHGSAVFVVREVTFWVGEGFDYAHCEYEIPVRDQYRFLLKQLEAGFGFEHMDY